MKFNTYFPSKDLQLYIRKIVISEQEQEFQYKVFPSGGLVLGFQYCGKLAVVEDGKENMLASAGITGLSDSFRIFKNSKNTGTVLVYFTETGFVHFTSHPPNELFNLSLSLDDIFDKESISKTEDRLAEAGSDYDRIKILENFLFAHLKDVQNDLLITEAIKLIREGNGTIRIRELIGKLAISQSPFEKRFRKIVGASPKKFASVVRFNAALEKLSNATSLTSLCYESSFFDQAHFSKTFKRFAGESPGKFSRR